MEEKKLLALQTPYVDAQTLVNLFDGYARPRERILRLIKNEELIRLKNGFYLIASKIQSGRGIPYEQVANMLYGPSYVSLEWALSFYGMIPEKVHTITSMTLGKTKNFQTPVGNFHYTHLSASCYSIGVNQMQNPDFLGGYLMGTPEKALADTVFKTCQGLNKDALRVELIESKRIDPKSLASLDKELLSEIQKSYRSKVVRELIDLLGTL